MLRPPSIENKARYVHQLFESIAGQYDHMNTLLSFRQHKIWRKFAMEKMNVLPGDTAIDVCCGTCDWTIALAKASKVGTVIGLDFSANMLEMGRMKIANLQLEQIELIKGDAMKIPFPDNFFDHATIGFALRNVRDIVQVLEEMKRVVKPGGKVVSLDLSKPTNALFRRIYYFYFQKLVPIFGYVFAKKYGQYKWLPESLLQFPDYEQLKKIMADQVGLQEVQVFPFTGGIVALHIGRKPSKEES